MPFLNKKHWGFIIIGYGISFLIKLFGAFTFSVITGIFSLFLFTLKSMYFLLFSCFFFGGVIPFFTTLLLLSA